jgi:hypothetical protein
MTTRRGVRGTIRRRIKGYARIVLAGAVVAGVLALSGGSSSASSGATAVWSVVANPNPSNNEELPSVSCASLTWCVAVGNYGFDNQYLTMIETWDGTSWSVVPSPNTDVSINVLTSVSCTSVDFCLAVGYDSPSGDTEYPQTLAELWNGSSWSIIDSPNVSSTDSFTDISCSTATYCVAVGGAGLMPIAALWNGTTWSITLDSQLPGTNVSGLNSVSCTGTGASPFCVAAGAFNGPRAFEVLIETWNGSTWTVASTSNPPVNHGTNLSGVSCASPTSCTAVGSVTVKFGNQRKPSVQNPVIETWNGTTWSLGTGLNPKGNSQLGSVSCPSASSCIALGVYGNREFFESESGGAWSMMKAPQVEGGSLADLSCSYPGSCAAVGIVGPDLPDKTLVMMTGSMTLTHAANLAGGKNTSVGATPGTFVPGEDVAITECNPDPSLMAEGEGAACDLSDQTTVAAGPDGSVAPTPFTVRTGPIGTDPAATCPPTPSQVEAGGGQCYISMVGTSSGAEYHMSIYFAATMSVSPTSGTPGTTLTLSGSGFMPGETVANTYFTSRTVQDKIPICTAVAAADGTWTCSGPIPTGKTAGSTGSHKIVGSGSVSGDKATGTITLTS